jgi:hypothetical protein
MKVIAEQAIGECVGDGFDVVSIEPEKVDIVSLFSKNVFAVDAAIVDMIINAGFEGNGFFHEAPFIDLEGLADLRGLTAATKDLRGLGNLEGLYHPLDVRFGFGQKVLRQRMCRTSTHTPLIAHAMVPSAAQERKRLSPTIVGYNRPQYSLANLKHGEFLYTYVFVASTSCNS